MVWPFRQKRPFEVNPLSLSVPQTAFETWAQERRQSREVNAVGSKSLSTMTVEDLMEKPKPWREFFALEKLMEAYEFPSPFRIEAKIRITANVFDYIGNYLRIALVLALCVLYKKPIALLGLMVIAKAWDWIRVRGTEVDPHSFFYRVQYTAVQIMSWVLLVFSQVALALSLAAFLSLAVICFHGLLRKPGRLPPTRKKS